MAHDMMRMTPEIRMTSTLRMSPMMTSMTPVIPVILITLTLLDPVDPSVAYSQADHIIMIN